MTIRPLICCTSLACTAWRAVFASSPKIPRRVSLQHGEWLAILLEHEATVRRQKRFEARARTARLRHAASVEDIDYHAQRGLDRALFLKLATCEWIREHHHLVMIGPTGPVT